jgi:hypothetical protein
LAAINPSVREILDPIHAEADVGRSTLANGIAAMPEARRSDGFRWTSDADQVTVG